MPDIEKAVKFMEDIANDPAHGYAQDHRNGDPDYDCSSLVGTALNIAGFNVSKGSTTRNLYQQLKNCGFIELPIDAPRKRGDVMLSVGHHVVVCTDENNIVHASLNENGGIKNGQSGDQTGKEICIRSYYNHKNSWTYHLRYNSSTPATQEALICDISHHNLILDWLDLSREVEGVIVRAGYRGYQNGNITEDKLFDYHIKELTKRNVKVGLYFYSQAITEAEGIEEARWIIEKAKPYKMDYPIFIDSEYANSNHNGRADALSKSSRTKITIAFCNEIAKAGYTAGVYASENWFKNQLDFNQLGNYFIWVAKYSQNKPTTAHYDAWQYGSKQFSWAKAPIDVNHWYKNTATVTPVPSTQSFKNVVKVNTHLNIRNKPVSGDIVGRLNNNDSVVVIGYQKGWLKIGNDQWVSEAYVHSSYGIVTANSLNVRKGNSTSYESLGFVRKNNNVKIVKELGGWYQIITPEGLFGWASGKYIDLI